jgi:hypothetical protein
MALIASFSFTAPRPGMDITKEVLLKEKAFLHQQIADLQQDLLAKDGALQMVEGLLRYLEKEEPDGSYSKNE